MPQEADTGRPAYTNLNRLLVLIIVSLSASLRFGCALNGDITSPSLLRPVEEPYGTVVCAQSSLEPSRISFTVCSALKLHGR